MSTTSMTVNEYLANAKELGLSADGKLKFLRVVPPIVCADGLRLSVQASAGHYCEPQNNDAEFYTHVEIGYPSQRIEELMPYAETPDDPTGSVYARVPVEIVDAVISAHGGIAQ